MAPYFIRDTANTITAITGQPATVAQTYAGYMMGPTNGAKIAAAQPDVLLTSLGIPSNFLTNNRLSTTTTVSQFNDVLSSRLGNSANQLVLTGS